MRGNLVVKGAQVRPSYFHTDAKAVFKVVSKRRKYQALIVQLLIFPPLVQTTSVHRMENNSPL